MAGGAGGADERAVADVMAVLRARSVATNLNRIEVIAGALEAMRDGVLDEKVRAQARSAAHSLAGSAGTFGFRRASELARGLESLLSGGGDFTQGAQQGLERVDELRAALAVSAFPAAEPGAASADREPQ